MQGRVIALQGGLYTISTGTHAYQVRGAGILRHHRLKPIVGDVVEFAPSGNLEAILPRHNELLRPRIANADQVALVFSAAAPRPNLKQLYRVLVSAEVQNLKPLIIVTKTDLIASAWCARFQTEGYDCFEVTPETDLPPALVRFFANKLTVLVGASGVGKSTLVSRLTSLDAKVGAISAATRRGKHTTREVRFYAFGTALIADTPGFSSFTLVLKPLELASALLDFRELSLKCRFSTCLHQDEPAAACAVKRAVQNGKMSAQRYAVYLELLSEAKRA